MDAEEKYAETVDMIFKSFDVDPPWQAKFEFDENKTATAVVYTKDAGVTKTKDTEK